MSCWSFKKMHIHMIQHLEVSHSVSFATETNPSQAPRPTRSWERRRPGLGRPSRQPPPPNARVPPPRVQPVNTRTGYRRPLSPGFPGQGSPLPPHPGGSSSPPSSVTTSSLGESNDTSSSMSAHWLAEVWMQHRSNTQFHTTGTEYVSVCASSEML